MLRPNIWSKLIGQVVVLVKDFAVIILTGGNCFKIATQTKDKSQILQLSAQWHPISYIYSFSTLCLTGTKLCFTSSAAPPQRPLRARPPLPVSGGKTASSFVNTCKNTYLFFVFFLFIYFELLFFVNLQPLTMYPVNSVAAVATTQLPQECHQS